MAKGEEGARRALSYDDRLIIERSLNRGDPLGMIARTLGRTTSTVREEVRRNWTDRPQGILTVTTRNICVKKFGCSVTGLCKTLCARECRRCKGWKCNELFPDFEAEPCPKLSRAPYCCNDCIERVGGRCEHHPPKKKNDISAYGDIDIYGGDLSMRKRK